jgi:RNA polymerase sigma-70 factor (ECF subfamily)
MSTDFREDSLIHEMIEGCRKNKLKCQEMLYKHFFGYALTIGMRYTGDYHIAMEIVDDSFMKTFEKIHSYNNNQDFKAWFRKIVVNTAIDKLRQKQGRYEKERTINSLEVLSISASDPDSGFNSDELLNLLKGLPYLHRSVFNLFEIEGFSHKEIAELLQIPESSSRTYLTRAKKELRELYKKHFL